MFCVRNWPVPVGTGGSGGAVVCGLTLGIEVLNSGLTGIAVPMPLRSVERESSESFGWDLKTKRCIVQVVRLPEHLPWWRVTSSIATFD